VDEIQPVSKIGLRMATVLSGDDWLLATDTS
jgi:hypothetical protein